MLRTLIILSLSRDKFVESIQTISLLQQSPIRQAQCGTTTMDTVEFRRFLM